MNHLLRLGVFCSVCIPWPLAVSMLKFHVSLPSRFFKGLRNSVAQGCGPVGMFRAFEGSVRKQPTLESTHVGGC